MYGIKYEGSNFALSISCDEKDPDAICKYNNIKLKWSDYVNLYLKEWKFDFS
jgi:hypothetical protein